jgi:U3 small nucleolar RNA-associated protein MPP10
MALIGDSVSSATSHTLSLDATQLPSAELHSSSQQALLSTLSRSPHTFLQAPPSLNSAALVLAKRYLDPLASTISEIQLQRLHDGRKKRKRSEYDAAAKEQLLQLNQLYLDGFSTDQVWEQARRVLDASRAEVERALPDVAPNGQNDADSPLPVTDLDQDGVRTVQFDEDGFELDESDEDSLEDENEEMENNVDGKDEDEGESGVELDDDEMLDGNLKNIEDYEDSEEEQGPQQGFVEDPNGLNDGFFSIDDFNKHSEFLERQDAAGDPFDGQASDEESIDWDADPVSMQATASKRSAQNTEEDESEDEDDGPTFGSTDLNEEFDEDEEDLEEGEELQEMTAFGTMDNTNDIQYADFFEPPPRKMTRGELQKSYTDRRGPATKPAGVNSTEAIERTMDAVRRDLFEDDASAADLSDVDAADPKSRRSHHERRQAKLAEEIRKLEAANVAKREWTLSGEARAADRPVNSLLEEDLEFERQGKPVPVITAEVSEEIEDLIKRRVLAQEFDEVIRRRPDGLGDGAVTNRGRFELSDSKGPQSLAEMYEEDHLRDANPDTYISKSDEKLRMEHQEIDGLWRDVCSKLDALSHWHYKPKAAKASLTIVADVPTIAMEDARPSAAIDGAEMGSRTMLAPQEVYQPGMDGKKETGAGEVVPRSGVPVSSEEMTREEKLRRRRRDKERLKKRLGHDDGSSNSRQAQKRADRAHLVDSLKKGGVGVIGKKGEIRDVDGQQRNHRGTVQGGGGFKL